MTNSEVIDVVDDDDAARHSLEFLLRTAKFDVRAHRSATDFLKLLPGLEVSCVVTDVRMPGVSGIELLKHLKKQLPAVAVIVITGHGDVPLAVEAMKCGAADFIEKPFDDDRLLTTVRAALSKQARDDEGVAERGAILDKLATLSNRERQVLEGLVNGLPNKSIAYDLAISPRTVEIYRANLMTKMGAKSLSDLVRMALVAGMLERKTPT
ncbi:MAG TPA: response regulator FixJ [Pseudolabrys sp.]|jgi:two-component system response regulator FixJ|nr:response regulator FixJ [Pseudolabrys sp.]